MEAYEDQYAFEDCQGVFPGDNSPLFIHTGHEVASFHYAAAAAGGGSGSAMSSSRF
jgi:hypothetical protein